MNPEAPTPAPPQITDGMLDQARDKIRRAANRGLFRRGLEQLINRYSMEGGSDTHDFLLADYLMACLTAYETTVNERKRLSAHD